MSELAYVEQRMRDWRTAEFLASLVAMVDNSHATQDWHAMTVGMSRGYRFRLAELASESYKPDGCTCNDDYEVGSGYRCKACKEADRKRGARG